MEISRNQSRIFCTALGTILSVGVSPAWGQTLPPAPQTEPAASSGATDSGDIIVTAQRRSQDIQSVPISISAFSGKKLQDQGIKSTTDLGQIVSNVTIALPQSVGNQPIITIRGIGLNDYDSNNAGPNGVYLDDVYMSSPSSQSFQTFDLDRIEVLKGPQGTLYGRNTSGGAINLITAKPADQFSARFHLEYSSYNTVNVEGAVGGPITDTLDGRLAFVENYSGGYVHNTFLGKRNGTQNYGARAMLLYRPNSDLKILFNAHGGQVDNPFPGYQHLGDFKPGTQLNVPVQCTIRETLGNQCVDLFGYGGQKSFYDEASGARNRLKVNAYGGFVRIDYSPGPVSFTSISAYEHLDKVDEEDGDSTPNRLLEATFGVDSNALSQEFRLSEDRGNFNWVFGLYYLHENLKQDQPIYLLRDGDKFFGEGAFDGVALTQSDLSRQVTDSYAAFGQAEYALTSKLRLVAGGRLTHERKAFQYQGAASFQDGGIDHFSPPLLLADTNQKLEESAFSWRLGLNYKPAEHVLAYASVATGFKSGAFNGSFLSTDPAEIERQLQPVKPEKVTAYELGVKASFWGGRLIANAALFYNDYRDMQVFVLVPPVPGGTGQPLNVLDNAQRAHTEGLDLSIALKPWTGFTLSSEFGLLRTNMDKFIAKADVAQPNYSGNQLSMAPRVSATISADCTVPIGAGSMDVQLTGSYKSHQFFDISNDPYTDQGAYWLLNSRIAYSFSAKKYEIALFSRNMTAKKYYVDKFDLTNPFGFIQGIVGAPRTFGVEFNAKY